MTPEQDVISDVIGFSVGDTSAFEVAKAAPDEAPTYYGIPLDEMNQPVADPGEAPRQAPELPTTPPPSQQQTQANPEVEQLRKELDQYRQMVPIMEHIYQDPRLAAKVFEVIDESARPQAPKEPPPPAEPKRPDQPTDYSHEMAYSDPTSSSWKYREAMERYRYDMAEHKASMAEYRAARLEQMMQQQQMAQQEAAMRQRQYEDALARGATPQEAAEYVEFLSRPGVDANTLWQLYRVTKGGASVAPQGSGNVQPNPQGTPNPVQERARRLDYPAPPVNSAPSGSANKPVQDLVFDELLAYERGRNPFT